jgi:hypothetical protein
MSFATETLAKAQAAYQAALDSKARVKFGEREVTSHGLGELLKQVNFWQAKVNEETARAAGRSSRAPIRFNL